MLFSIRPCKANHGLVVRPMKSFLVYSRWLFCFLKSIEFMFCVYILYSKSLQIYYKGFSTDFLKRLEYHNSGMSTYTSRASDWELVYLKSFEIKKDALIEEKRLKKLNKSSLLRLIQDFTNN